MNIRHPVRIAACGCLGVAVAMGLVALREEPKPEPSPRARATDLPTDPLQTRIWTCQRAGQAAGSNPGCLAAWAENRQRFLGQRRLSPAGPTESDVPGKSFDAPIDAIANIQQEQ